MRSCLQKEGEATILQQAAVHVVKLIMQRPQAHAASIMQRKLLTSHMAKDVLNTGLANKKSKTKKEIADSSLNDRVESVSSLV